MAIKCGSFFGGQLLIWADKTAYSAATLKYPKCRFVGRALEATEFKTLATNGEILELTGEVVKTRETSCKVLVSARDLTTGREVFSTDFIMVNIIEGSKQPIQVADAKTTASASA